MEDKKLSNELDDLFYKLVYHDLKRAYHAGKWRECLNETMSKFKEEYSDLHKGDVLDTFKALEEAKRAVIEKDLYLGEE